MMAKVAVLRAVTDRAGEQHSLPSGEWLMKY